MLGDLTGRRTLLGRLRKTLVQSVRSNDRPSSIGRITLVVATLHGGTALALEPPHDDSHGVVCVDCHALHDDPQGWGVVPRELEQEAMCKSCHNPTGLASSMAAVSNHTVDGGSTVVDCGSCHDAHKPSLSTDPHAGGQTLPNLKLIRSDIAKYYPGALEPAVFQQAPEHFAFADGDPPYNGVCQSCHQQTNHHTRDGGADHVHGIGSLCSGCHNHDAGFVAPTDGCLTCHGYPPADLATLVASPPTGSTTAGAHTVHANDQGYACDWCHVDSAGFGPTHTSGSVTIGFSLFAGGHSGGDYDGQATVSYDASEGDTTVASSGAKSCSRIYCHGQLADGTVWGGGQAVQPSWDGTVTCTSCHDGGGSATALSGRHDAHTEAATYAFSCDRCHAATVSGSTVVVDRTLHANNLEEVSFLVTGSYDKPTGGCSGTYCHSDGRGGPPNTAVAWGDAGPASCDYCHNGMASDTLEMATDGHETLIGSGWVRQYPCNYCHADTVDGSGQIADYGRHVNESVDVAIAAQWNIVGYPVPAYDAATQTCSDVYCHSDGTTVTPAVRDFAWTDQHTKCNSCHGHPAGQCDACHNDGRTDWPVGEEWKAAMPMYPNTGPGTDRANSHLRHLQTNFTCDNCHVSTIVNGDCLGCHSGGVPPGTMHETNHINAAVHVNKVKDVVFKDGGTYDPVTKTCSSTTCHTGGTPQWGDSVSDEVLCFTCHGTTGGDVDDFDAFNGVRALINMTEWEDSGHGRTSASGPYASGHPAANFPGNPCWYCHDNTSLHNDADNPLRLMRHPQFEQRFEKECVYCHMEGIDGECLACHDDPESLAPQLNVISGPPDHAPYTGGAESCVDVCHDTDATRHKTDAGLWTAQEKADVQNQYVMMGVCLQCHDDDSNGQCQQCHSGPQYVLGYDPGTGHIAGTTKATSTHFGYKHFAQYQNNGVWKGGKFCWDCHDPHGDSNIYMVQDQVATETEGTFGVPVSRAPVSFTRKQTGLDYASTSAPYDGICNVCHTEAGQHYQDDYGDGHNAGRICTSCHEHRFTDSHSSGQACNSCHANKPVPRHTAFGLPRDCTKCHDGIIGDRMDILGQFRSSSHHIQGVPTSNRHCYACHWEATDLGLIDVAYHGGYNHETHQTVPDAPVDLVRWGPGFRPTLHQPGITAVTFAADQIGTPGERGAVSNVTQHCLGCHSAQNDDTTPFGVVDPLNDDCKTPRQYAWDGTSVGARYSQVGTAPWGKYSGEPGAAPKSLTKAFSAHGNAVANEGGWTVVDGEDAALPNTRNGSEGIQCFDCHSSHGSKTAGITSSYVTFNGTQNGGNLKETQAGKGGYQVTYKATAGGGVSPHNAGAAQCFDCHETASAGATPWGYQSTFGAAEPIQGYRDGSRFDAGSRGVTSRFAYKAAKDVTGGHFAPSSQLQSTPMGTIGGLCTPCHDPHGVSPTLGADQAYAVPMLKGTWLTSPYREDRPIEQVHNERFSHPIPPTPNVYIDQNTFSGVGTIDEDEGQFAGLCLRCHPKDDLTDGTDKNQPWRSLDRVHESVKGWGANTKHSYPCSKCHQAHNSGLPRLLRTNALDYTHRGRVESGGVAGIGSRGSFPRGDGFRMQNCHPTPEGWPNNDWNDKSPW